MNSPALKELVVDLRSPPSGFPKFNLEYNFFIDEDDKTYGDITAYVAARKLGHPNRIPQFLAKGGDIVALTSKATGITVAKLAELVYPPALVGAGFDMSLVTGPEMADVVQGFLDTGKADYTRILQMLDDNEEFIAAHTRDGVRGRVTEFLNEYGHR